MVLPRCLPRGCGCGQCTVGAVTQDPAGAGGPTAGRLLHPRDGRGTPPLCSGSWQVTSPPYHARPSTGLPGHPRDAAGDLFGDGRAARERPGPGTAACMAAAQSGHAASRRAARPVAGSGPHLWGGGRGISFHIFKGGVSKTLWTYLKPDTVCFLPTNYSRFSHLQSTPTLPWTAARVRPLQARSSEAQA